MAELEPQNPPADPIAALHKMSTTAGVAASEYVAINNLAIASTVLGLLTSLAIAWPLLSIVGAAGIVCGLLGFRQIRNSNGTQAGKGLALTGILLSLGLAGTSAGMSIAREIALGPEKQAINGVIAKLGQLVSEGNYDGAYQLFAQDFRGESPRDFFEQRWRMQQEPVRGAGRLLSMRGNGIFSFDTLRGMDSAATQGIAQFEKASDGRVGIVFVKEAGQWRIFRIPGLFDREPPPKRR